MTQLDWQKSSFSSGDPNSDCLEIASASDGHLRLRESDDPSTILTTSPARLRALLDHARAAVDLR